MYHNEMEKIIEKVVKGDIDKNVLIKAQRYCRQERYFTRKHRHIGIEPEESYMILLPHHIFHIRKLFPT